MIELASKMTEWLLARSYRDIASDASGYPYVPFDVFDTLLLRTVAKPEDVFRKIGKSLGCEEEFFQLRKRGERFARKHGAEEVALCEIYQAVKELSSGSELAGFDISELMSMELDVERQVSLPNEPMRGLFDSLKDSRKLVILSDMYQTRAFVSELLKRAGYALDDVDLFVSSEVGKTKRSGSLYRHAQKELDIQPNEIFHIGNSARSDYFAARRCGWNAALIPPSGWRQRR